MMVLGGRSRRVRDMPLVGFLVGHSLQHWLLQLSSLPLHFMADDQLVLPPGLQAKWGTHHMQLASVQGALSSAAIPMVSAAA